MRDTTQADELEQVDDAPAKDQTERAPDDEDGRRGEGGEPAAGADGRCQPGGQLGAVLVSNAILEVLTEEDRCCRLTGERREEGSSRDYEPGASDAFEYAHDGDHVLDRQVGGRHDAQERERLTVCVVYFVAVVQEHDERNDPYQNACHLAFVGDVVQLLHPAVFADELHGHQLGEQLDARQAVHRQDGSTQQQEARGDLAAAAEPDHDVGHDAAPRKACLENDRPQSLNWFLHFGLWLFSHGSSWSSAYFW